MRSFYHDVVNLQVVFGHDLQDFKHEELMILGLRKCSRTCIVFISFKYVQVGLCFGDPKCLRLGFH